MPDDLAPRSLENLDLQPRGRVQPSPQDWRERVIYQVMLDRFDDGQDRPMLDPAHPDAGREQWSIENGRRWQGGTLKGLTRRLDYIQNLGADTIWISPPLKQRAGQEGSYHGYGIQDFFKIDPHFGTFDDFRAFVDAAHDRGMLVIMDIVIDHVADLWAYEQPDAQWNDGQVYERIRWHEGDPEKGFGDDEGIWPRELQTPEAFVRKGPMRDVGTAHGDEAMEGDFMSLKGLDLRQDWVLDAMVKIHQWWMAKADVDGFRIDAFRHILLDPARRFCQMIEEFAQSIGKTDFFMVGEVAGSERDMMRYVASNVPLDAEGATQAQFPRLDAVLDFDMHRKFDAVLRGEESAEDLRRRFEFLSAYHRDFADAARHYVTWVENHDQGDSGLRRFLNNTGVEGQDRPGGDPRLAVLGHAMVLLGWGVPCLYYGTEQGFDGGEGEDTFVRECMFGGTFGPFCSTGVHTFDETHPAYVGTARLAKLRQENPVLRFGRQFFREISPDGIGFGHPNEPLSTLAFSRVLADHEALVVINPSLDERQEHVAVDGNLLIPGSTVRDVWNDRDLTVEQTDEGQAFVRLNSEPRGLSVIVSTR